MSDLCTKCLYCRNTRVMACLPPMKDFETKPDIGVVRCSGFAELANTQPKEFKPNFMQVYAMYGIFMAELGLRPPDLDGKQPDESTFLDMTNKIQDGLRELRRRFEPSDELVAEFRNHILSELFNDKSLKEWEENNFMTRTLLNRRLDQVIRENISKLGKLE